MKPIRTKAVVLRRTNYGEADRILQLLTPDNGKIAAMAKGVRREKSKLAGGVELFAISDLTVVPGKGDIWTLTGAKMDTFFAHIMADYDRMQFAYEVIKQVSKATEQVSDSSYYTLLTTALASLDDQTISLDITSSWFWLQLAILEGQGLNLSTDVNGMKLVEGKRYKFDTDEMAFVYHENGEFSTEHIKLLRLLSAQNPKLISLVKDNASLFAQVLWLAGTVYAH